MEEKKVTKISLSTFFLILAIIVILFMVYYIYTEKKDSDKEISTLKENTEEMKNTINSLQEKSNSTSNTINSNINNENNDYQQNTTTSNIENKGVTFSNNEIKTTLQNYLDLIGAKEGSPINMLVKLGLCNYGDYNNVTPTDDNYIKTNIKYSTFKEKMLQYVTEECFYNNFNTFYKDQNGILYYFDGGATGMQFEVKDISIKGDYSSQAYIAQVYTINLDDSKELNNIEFHIANNNGKCVISYCD